ncbi:unnamed protein product [Rotaria magnacalcarata]|uniref:RRM domain-containing protein n=2 Tax=Rotaria magnacalcarata TaxID=392030 RepID=A0A816VDR0_9BILA|nr:unnamed protein product [Rotaria magnacalcarata]CAF4425277.1 unnamed protein product [Rotaria magnacalcarata]
MLFDCESTVVITKFNSLSDSALIGYCQNFGKIIRWSMKTSTQANEPYALIMFATISSATSILSHSNHTIDGVHVLILNYQQHVNRHSSVKKPANLKSLTKKKKYISDGKERKSMDYDQIMQENIALKHEIANLNQLLVNAHIACDEYQVLQKKIEAEQILTNKFKLEYGVLIESYESRLKQLSLSLSSRKTIKNEHIDIDCQRNHLEQHSFEMKIRKDRMEQTQISLDKDKRNNTSLNAKLIEDADQFFITINELSNQYICMKKQNEHLSSCIQDFQANLYPNVRLKSKLIDSNINQSDQENINNNKETNDINEENMEITIKEEPKLAKITCS